MPRLPLKFIKTHQGFHGKTGEGPDRRQICFTGFNLAIKSVKHVEKTILAYFACCWTYCQRLDELNA